MAVLLDPKDPIYKPLWRRIAIVGAIIGWGFLEFSWDNALWGWGFVLFGLWVAWRFISAARTPDE